MKQTILNVVTDLVSNLMYYDRKEDEDLPRGAIEKAVEDGVITYEEIAEAFRDELISQMVDEDADELDVEKLVEICTAFIEDNKVTCDEACMNDSVYENAPELVGEIAKLVGYYEYPDEDDEQK